MTDVISFGQFCLVIPIKLHPIRIDGTRTIGVIFSLPSPNDDCRAVSGCIGLRYQQARDVLGFGLDQSDMGTRAGFEAS